MTFLIKCFDMLANRLLNCLTHPLLFESLFPSSDFIVKFFLELDFFFLIFDYNVLQVLYFCD